MAGYYMPEDQRDATWYIFNKGFMCRVPYLQTMSADYIRHFGVVASGDPLRDQALCAEMITTMLTIAKMIEYFEQGVIVRVCKVEDTKVIYEYLAEHLNMWRQQLERGLNNRNAPIDDLLLMDRFASAVYKHARHHFTQEFVDGILARQMLGSMRVNKTNMFRPINQPEEPVVDQDGEPKFPERESMAEIFATSRTQARRTWNDIWKK